MSCNAPLEAWRRNKPTKNGKLSLSFTPVPGQLSMPIPCGKCMGCRLDKAKEWALRCWHESQMWESSCFVTLTYSDRSLPRYSGTPTLNPRHFQLFMKRLRKARHDRVRFFQCGEYGNLGRPHHHALLFNCSFADRELHSRSGDSNLYRSAELEKLWPHGFSTIGDVTFESAGYVARYTLKKQPCTGKQIEVNQLGQARVRTYLTMSRRPGIGKQWLDSFLDDTYNYDECVTPTGYLMKPPRFYDKQLPDSVLSIIKEARLENRKPVPPLQQLRAREAIAKARFSLRKGEALP